MNGLDKIHKLLHENRMIAHIWCLEDVEHVRPDLTENQCWEVLQRIEGNLDAELGVTWETLRIAAESLFGYYDDEED